MFIVLTKTQNTRLSDEVRVNIRQVVDYERIEQGDLTKVCLTNGKDIKVKETPEDLDLLIEKVTGLAPPRS